MNRGFHLILLVALLDLLLDDPDAQHGSVEEEQKFTVVPADPGDPVLVAVPRSCV